MDTFSEQLSGILLNMYKNVINLEENARKNVNSRINLTINEIHFLEAVGAGCRKGCTVSRLAAMLGVSKPSVTVMVSKLEKKGFLEKLQSQEDGRSVKVMLTREGSLVNSYYKYFRRRMVKKINDGLTDQEKEFLVKAFEKINIYFKESLERIE
ncbi:MAG: MarR family transcriptional regulator [Spirochaetia bacterium]|nr:MarR family transcriptional regulator [Spirochaetales bacterium]MBR5916227.1 MarR family transcriptional regulator [Spirochaetia bacterium]MBR5926985.1 MarR family transcriptional regulator [Spirochaetia bacterium]